MSCARYAKPWTAAFWRRALRFRVSGEKTQPGQGGSDYWLVKLNATGGLEWDRTYGGAGVDALLDLVLTTDGGYALAGYSSSRVSGDKTQPPQGDNSDDFLAAKVGCQGHQAWDRTVGGAYLDHPHSVVQTADGGYVLSGVSYSAFRVIRALGSGRRRLLARQA
jgi:hypothetical protein